MRVFKFVVLFVFPILIFFNLWRLAIVGEGMEYKGLRFLLDYTQSYQGFQATYDTFANLGQYIILSEPSFFDVLVSIFWVMWSPVAILGALITDLVNNIVFFFGWIFNTLAVA